MTRAEALQAAEELQRGREVLLRDGWCQRDLENHRGRRCALGAVNKGREDAFQHTQAVECLSVITGSLCVWPWNDRPGRTVAEVLRAFDEATSLALSEAEGMEP